MNWLRSAGMVLPTRVLAVGVTIDVLLGFNTYAILALSLPRVLVRNALLGLVVSVIACATLIPRLGAVGAAAATAIAILAVNGLASLFLWHRMNFAPWDRPLVLSVAAFVAGTGAAILLSRLVALNTVHRKRRLGLRELDKSQGLLNDRARSSCRRFAPRRELRPRLASWPSSSSPTAA